MEKAAHIENPIVVKEHGRERHDFDPTVFYENSFWNRRQDGILINKNYQTVYILEFKRSSDRNNFLGVKEDEANEQHKSIIDALKAAARKWTSEQINFVAGRHGVVVEDNFDKKLERLSVQEGKEIRFCWHIFNAYAEHMTAAPEWTFEQINFVAGRRGASVKDDFYNKLERLSVQAGKRVKILAVHVQRICEAHDTVIRSYYQQIYCL